MRKIKKAVSTFISYGKGLSLVACGGNDDATTEATTEAKAEATEAASVMLQRQQRQMLQQQEQLQHLAQMAGMTARRSTLTHGMRISQRR